MRCRAGALRGRRSLRDGYTPFGSRLPLVAWKIFVPATGRPGRSRYTPHEVGATRVGCLSGRTCLFPGFSLARNHCCAICGTLVMHSK
jgi:hypothetical protein